MAKTMLGLVVPGVALGFSMMPAWWIAVLLLAAIGGFTSWRLAPESFSRGTKCLILACAATLAASLFFYLAVRFAERSCSTPPADGLCTFTGLPYLSVSALALLVALVAWIQYARLRS